MGEKDLVPPPLIVSSIAAVLIVGRVGCRHESLVPGRAEAPRHNCRMAAQRHARCATFIARTQQKYFSKLEVYDMCVKTHVKERKLLSLGISSGVVFPPVF